jgi:hypothetical protein
MLQFARLGRSADLSIESGEQPYYPGDSSFSIRAYPRGKPYTLLLFHQLPKPLTTPKAIEGGVGAGLFAVVRVEAHGLL